MKALLAMNLATGARRLGKRLPFLASLRPAIPSRRSAKSLGRRGRATLLWTLAAVAILQLGLRIAIDGGGLAGLRDPFWTHKADRLKSRLEPFPDGGRPTTVVMLGSSRTAFGFRGQDLERQLGEDLGRPVVAFNFGIPGAGPLAQLLHLRRLLDEEVRPDLLLVEVLPPFLAGQHSLPAEAAFLPADRVWANELGVLERCGYPMAEVRPAWLEGWPVPWHSHRFAVVSAVSPSLLPWSHRQDWGKGTDASGWARNFAQDVTPERYRAGVEQTRAEYARCFEGFRLGGPACQALREILKLCRDRGLPVALVLMPEGTDFRGWYTLDMRVRLHTWLGGLSEEYGAFLVDASDWLADDAFSDSHHLLPAGATAFTDRLGREVLRPLLAGGQVTGTGPSLSVAR